MTPSFPSCLIAPELEPNSGFAAQIVRESPCDYIKLNKGHEKVDIADLRNDEPAILQCRRKAAGLVADLAWSAAPNGKRGRSATFSDPQIQTCRTLKALFGLPLLAGVCRAGWPARDFNTLCRRQKGLAVAIPYRQSSGALHLLIESSGIKAEGEGEWIAMEHEPSKPRQWRKVYLGIDAGTVEIRAIEGTGSRVGDAPMLPELLNKRSRDATGPSRAVW